MTFLNKDRRFGIEKSCHVSHGLCCQSLLHCHSQCAQRDNNRLVAYGDVIQVRKFKAINTGSVGVTFAVDNKTLEKSGFTVSPDKVPMLTGAPTHAALELTVTLQVGMHAVIN